MKYDFRKVIALPENRGKKNSYEAAEKKMKVVFPQDYKEWIDCYGGGAINGFLWILSPFSDNPYLNIIDSFTEMRSAYNRMKSDFPKDFKYSFYNGKKGLFPWGATDNGDELYWNIQDGDEEIVVCASRYAEMISYKMSMEEFLFKLLSKEIECSAFPEDFFLVENYYKLSGNY